jgi:tetrahydromethanopterin S-methyltransferase subunit A
LSADCCLKIRELIKLCLTNKEIAHLILCGKDGRGHRPGNSLIVLSHNGITKEGEIIMSKSPYPLLTSSYEQVQMFRDRITIHNLIEETDLNSIRAYLYTLV